MKILAIRGENLASLEGEFEVDFSREPLLSAGIFAITGPTGAGKSTILDALCLALFDNAPRLSRAENFKIEEENQDKLTLKDSRNILRKGSAAGYAEVDFVALNGDKYRSRWSLRRARDKASGSLQNAVIQLDNLTNNEAEQGKKTELLSRIVELIGLNFDQFTRAVLLAQGDFASFLKAKQTEKAELLEKLTGTEIYSKISTLIYTKSAEAKADLDLHKQRMADIKLLSEEEIIEQNKEKEDLTKEAELIKQELAAIEKKLNWIKQNAKLQEDIDTAEKKLAQCEIEHKEAAPRYEYIKQLDSSGEIRDSYIALANRNKQQTKDLADLETHQNKQKELEQQFVQIDADLKLSKAALDELEQKYETLKPEMDKAKELDLQIKGARERLAEISDYLQANKKKLLDISEGVEKKELQLSTTKAEQVKLADWFANNKQYKEIVPKVDLILKSLTALQTAAKQLEKAENGLATSKGLLDKFLNQLQSLEKEEGRLNTLLPTEVLNLRAKLLDGEPCAVCGALHHPFSENPTQENTIKEEELEKEKQELAAQLAELKNDIDDTKKDITAFEVYIKTCTEQEKESFDELKSYVSELSGWENLLAQGRLDKELESIAKHWNENILKQEEYTKELDKLNVQIEAENKALAIKNDECKNIEALLNKQNSILKTAADSRAALLNGKSVDAIETRYVTVKNQYTKTYEQQRDNKDKAESDISRTKGMVSQLITHTSTNAKAISELNDAVNIWLANNTYKIDIIKLQDLISKSPDWVKQEKESLSKLKDQLLELSTTLRERKTQQEKHQSSEDKPRENESEELLLETFAGANQQQDIKSKRLGEIEAAQKEYLNAKEQIQSFEKKLKSKEEHYNNWAKLNELLGSANGSKFKTIAQGYTLDALLDHANKQLEELTKRYKLEKIPNSLALQVIDNDSLGEVRPVHSLSGGESFLVSLSLALGLSTLSSQRMNIESLFIDEGFGSLDIDTLSIAMDALDKLQTQGRKIGVISHVEEMKERINTQIQVVKASNGRSVVRVVG